MGETALAREESHKPRLDLERLALALGALASFGAVVQFLAWLWGVL